MYTALHVASPVDYRLVFFSCREDFDMASMLYIAGQMMMMMMAMSTIVMVPGLSLFFDSFPFLYILFVLK